jgi:hypothetical protein
MRVPLFFHAVMMVVVVSRVRGGVGRYVVRPPHPFVILLLLSYDKKCQIMSMMTRIHTRTLISACFISKSRVVWLTILHINSLLPL